MKHAVFTRNEVEMILNRSLTSYHDIELATKELLPREALPILICGGIDSDPLFRQDFWTDGAVSFWLAHRRTSSVDTQKIKEMISEVTMTSIVKEYSAPDAIVIASMYANQMTRLGNVHLYPERWPEDEIDLPYLSTTPLQDIPSPFKRYQDIGLYPIVDGYHWLEKLLPIGIETIQLRIKNQDHLELEIEKSIALAKKYRTTLFINDHWELALRFGAEAVHLGQRDLDVADIKTIQQAGLLLGVSTHSYSEVARAHTIGPSYIAYGPIFPTTSKVMPWQPQGTAPLCRWRRTLKYPLVAIGGINLARLPSVLETGVNGVALISAITHAPNPTAMTRQFLERMG